MKVLLAADGSIEADLAEAILKRLPLPNLEIVVGMVVANPTLAFMPPGLPYDFDDGGIARLQHEVAERTVEHICHRLEAAGHSARSVVLTGDVAGQLLELIETSGFDLVACGSRIESNIRAAFLGSVSRKLALYARSSVLVAHHYHQKPADGSIERLTTKPKLDALIAVDGSPGSEIAVESLVNTIAPWLRKLYVMTVAERGARQTATDDSRRSEEIASEVAIRVAGCADEIIPITATGRPSTAIIKAANDMDLDLVLVGANQHGVIERLMVGSCAYETVTGAPCSVLVARKPLDLL
jgi:nucleotide-binding universal stress UspA family protein